ncbi:hypothetical protein [Tenacibaculum sp. SG-28]|uniref:hypothetical protein n=1 Tax=Tenacibaculum sp. SG-28 TaxID=754426 RepID=UPI0011B08113|nr:hypothetical protein [Tenacibaculum sp. SG-28]
MKHLLVLFLVVPSFFMAQEKIGNKIYKYGDLYHAIEGPTLISFKDAKAKTMSKTLEYFSDAGANVKSLSSLFMPGVEVSEEDFANTLQKNNIETLIVFDLIDSSSATMNRSTSSAFSTVNESSSTEFNRSSTNAMSYRGNTNSYNASSKGKAKSTSSSSSVNTQKVQDFVTEMSMRLTIFSKKDGFKTPVGVVEGRVTNGSPDTTADQLARRIVRRMAKALDKQNAF